VRKGVWGCYLKRNTNNAIGINNESETPLTVVKSTNEAPPDKLFWVLKDGAVANKVDPDDSVYDPGPTQSTAQTLKQLEMDLVEDGREFFMDHAYGGDKQYQDTIRLYPKPSIGCAYM
jgi:hypothetical protein